MLGDNRDRGVYFGAGPRGIHIPDGRLDQMLAHHPVLHINREEAAELSGHQDLLEAAAALHAVTKNTVIITLGPNGAFFMEKDGTSSMVPGVPAQVVDTIGAGDSHIGQVLASLSRQIPLKEAIRMANAVASKVVSVKGASLTDEEYHSLFSPGIQ